MAGMRYFALRISRDGRENAVFTGRQPRQAALKAASRGKVDIFLRERGTKKLHHFKGTRAKVRAPANRPDWMPAVVWKPNVRKLGVVHLAKPKKKAKKRRAKKRRTVKRKAVRRKTKRKAVKRKRTTKRKTKKRVTKRRTTKRRTVKKKAVRRKATRRKATKRTKRRRR